MGEQFLFRCRTCGRVAPESAWTLIGFPPRSDALNLRRYPRVRCPACEGADVDLNHGTLRSGEPRLRAHDPLPHRHEN